MELDMLLEFSLKNFKSFKEEVTLSFLPGSSTTLEKHIVGDKADKYRTLRSSIIYGSNGAGKTSLMDGARFMKAILMNSPNQSAKHKLAVPYFLFDEKMAKEPVYFQVVFSEGNDRYEYSFSFLKEGFITEELLCFPEKGRERTLFSRNNFDEFKLGRSLNKGPGFKKVLDSLQSNQLLVAAPTNSPELALVRDFIKSFEFIYSSDNLTDYTSKLLFHNNAHPNLKQNLDMMLSNIDKCIESVHVTLVTPEEAEIRYSEFPDSVREKIVKQHREEEIFDVYFKHKSSDKMVPIKDESHGTRRLYSMLGLLLKGINNSSVMFIDEMNSSLHPAVAEFVLDMIHNQKDFYDERWGQIDFRSQFVINLHDTTLLSPSILRPDQVWFVQKSDEGESELYSLEEFKSRSTAYQRNYLEGKYGAVPIIERFSLNEKQKIKNAGSSQRKKNKFSIRKRC